MKTWQQGDLGEASALEWLVSRGADVYVPFGHAPNVDLMADLCGKPIRVQVKTSRNQRCRGYVVQLSTRGGNQSWSGTAKLFDSRRCDFVFVLVADGRRWFIPAGSISARHSIVVGDARYGDYEIEPGRPLDSPAARWGTEAVKRDAL